MSQPLDPRSVLVGRLARAVAAALVIAAAAGFSATGPVTVPLAAAGFDPCEVSGVPRVVAVGDVHGAYESFTAILRATGLVDQDLHWSGGRAHLVQMGDLVDRGPQSRKVLDLLMRLEPEAEAAGGHVHALLGNHEVATMLGDWRYVSPAEYEEFRTPESEAVREQALATALASRRRSGDGSKQAQDEAKFREEFYAAVPLGWRERQAAFGPEGTYGRWLRARPTVVKVNGVVFVHGGLTPELAAMGCAAINKRVHTELTSALDKTKAAPLESLVARPDGPLWYRGLAQLPEAVFGLQVDLILRRMSARAIVSGHSVVPGGRVISRFGGRVYLVDTGMLSSVYQGGRASAIEFTPTGVAAIYEDGRSEPLSRDPVPNGG